MVSPYKYVKNLVVQRHTAKPKKFSFCCQTFETTPGTILELQAKITVAAWPH